MRRSRLVRRSLAHHARSYVAVLLASGTAAAVICGALLVGESVRGSLRDQALERLGPVEWALAGERFVREDLAGELEAEWGGSVVPAILLRGTVVRAGSGERAGGVSVLGVDERFFALGADTADWELAGLEAILNERLARELSVAAGEALLVLFGEASDIPREHALGARDETVARLRLSVRSVEPDRGAAIFDLRRQQEMPRNVFVPLARLQRALGQEGRANALLVTGGPRREARLAAPQEALARVWNLEDLGVRFERNEALGYAEVTSREFVLSPALVAACRRSATAAGVAHLEALTYLANRIRAGERSIPYSTVTAVSPWIDPGGGRAPPLEAGGLPLALWEPGGAILNAWALEELQAAPGDPITLEYYVLGPQHELIEEAAEFELRAAVPLEGDARDPRWTPEYPGVSDASTFSDWDPPFPIDHSRIREPGPDGDYWREYRTTPKVFLALEDGRRLWASRFGDLTSFRVRTAAGPEGARDAARFEAVLRREVDPTRFGLELRDVRSAALQAAESGTDFGGLFFGMSSFLIASALLLAGMMFRLATERRARELGMLTALGFPRALTRRLLLAEGLAVGGAGALAGAAAGVGYAALLVLGLKTLWRQAVNAPFLVLHADATSIFLSAAATVGLVLGVVFLVVRRLTSLSPRRLLAGEIQEELPEPRRGRAPWALGAAVALFGFAAAVLALGLGGRFPATEAFFAVGSSVLAGGLALLAWRLRVPGARPLRGHGPLALLRLGARNAQRAAGRSLLTCGLIACATFIVVTVAAMRSDPTASLPRKDSGNGGFALVARSASPLFASLATSAGRRDLGLDESTAALLDRSGATVVPFRERPGDETSCLNLYRPQEPRLLGAPHAFLERGGFRWAGSLAETPAEKENPWLVLEARRGEWDGDEVPAVGDYNTVRWILQAGLGDAVLARDDLGREIRLRIVGLLSQSIFQGSLVIAEDRFLERFPRHAGWSAFLVECDASRAGELGRALERDLADFGFDAQSTGELLAAYGRVQNTYLSTFLVLGGLGFLLGTLGLGAALLRSVLERQGELALLRALGFSRAALAGIVLSETAALLAAGVGLGAVSALLAVGPGIMSAQADVSWGLLLATLLAVLLAGLASSTLALRKALEAPLLPALRAE